jgi:hypothetical protein
VSTPPPSAAPTRTAPPPDPRAAWITVTKRRGGGGDYRWTAEIPVFHGLPAAAASRAQAGLTALIDAAVADGRREQRAEQERVTFEAQTTVTAWDTTYATVEVATEWTPHPSAHGASGLETYVIRRATGDRVTLTDLVRPGRLGHALRAMSGYARRRLPEVFGTPLSDEERAWLAPYASRYARITPLPEGLQVAFDAYRVGPGAAGFPRVVVPWEALAGDVRLPLPDGPRQPAYRDGYLATRFDAPAILAALRAWGAAAPDTYRIERVQIAQLLTADPHRWALATIVPLVGTPVVEVLRGDAPDRWRVLGSLPARRSALPAEVRKSLGI